VTLPLPSKPPPKSSAIVPPSRPSIAAGTNQAEIPGPVAIASQTCSGVPGTSIRTSADRGVFSFMACP
jgi:hypothetical protein